MCRRLPGVSTSAPRFASVASRMPETDVNDTGLPAILPIQQRGPLDATLRVPGSKSLTNRALVCAALAEGESQLEGALDSDDTRVMRGVGCGSRASLPTRFRRTSPCYRSSSGWAAACAAGRGAWTSRDPRAACAAWTST